MSKPLTLEDAEKSFCRMQKEWREDKPTQEELLAEERYREINKQFRGTHRNEPSNLPETKIAPHEFVIEPPNYKGEVGWPDEGHCFNCNQLRDAAVHTIAPDRAPQQPRGELKQ